MKETLLKTTKMIVSLLLAVVFTGTIFAGEKDVQPVARDIPENANRIIMQQEGQPPADMYVDAVQFLEKRGYKIVNAENPLETDSLSELTEKKPLVLRAEKKVSKDLTMQIAVNVNTMAGGSELAASVYYADSADVTAGHWNQASWTEGDSRKSFNIAFQDLRRGTYDTLRFESGVAVVRK